MSKSITNPIRTLTFQIYQIQKKQNKRDLLIVLYFNQKRIQSKRDLTYDHGSDQVMKELHSHEFEMSGMFLECLCTPPHSMLTFFDTLCTTLDSTMMSKKRKCLVIIYVAYVYFEGGSDRQKVNYVICE